MTLSVSDFSCKPCKITFSGEFKPQQRPRKSCPKCHKMCELTKSNQKPDAETGGEISTPPNESWFEMEDPELSRHTYREILLNNESTVRERLEAASKLVDLKYKSGTLDVKTQSEREVMDKFRQQDTKSLVDILKASSQKEHS